MAEPLSQERFNPLVSNQYDDDPIPDTDSSDMEDDSQPFAVALANENEMTISETSCESDEDSDPNHIDPTDNDYFVEETEASESESSQPNGSQPEFAADDEINIPATPSESDQDEDLSDHFSGIEIDVPRMAMNNTATEWYSPTQPINFNEANISPIRIAIANEENVVAEIDGSQRSLEQFALDSEITIPETPSQSDSEQDIEPNHSPAAFSNTMSQLGNDVVNVVANDESRRHTISPDIFDNSDDFVPNSINVAQLNAAIPPPALVSPDLFDDDPDDQPLGSQNAQNAPPVVVQDDFPFIVPGKPLISLEISSIVNEKWFIFN